MASCWKQGGANRQSFVPFTSAKQQRRRPCSLRTRCAVEIAGKNVVVIGASRGLGTEFARQLALKGNHVHATVRGAGSDELHSWQQKSEGVTIGHVDLSDSSSIQRWARERGSQSQAFDYAILTAGVVDDYADLDEVDEHRMLHCFKTNAIGRLLTAKALIEEGLLTGGSVLVNLTSKMGSLADNTSGGSYAYRASKSALNAITKSLAIDLENEGITVSLLHPGWVRTDMTRFSGLIDVDESVAGMISVLESDLPLHGHWYDYKHEEIPW